MLNIKAVLLRLFDLFRNFPSEKHTHTNIKKFTKIKVV